MSKMNATKSMLYEMKVAPRSMQYAGSKVSLPSQVSLESGHSNLPSNRKDGGWRNSKDGRRQKKELKEEGKKVMKKRRMDTIKSRKSTSW